jgi:hypothetical protein
VSGTQVLVLALFGVGIPLVVGAWRGQRLAIICGAAWGLTAFVLWGDVVTGALLFLAPAGIGVALARGFFAGGVRP